MNFKIIKKGVLLFSAFLLLFACQEHSELRGIYVKDIKALNDAIAQAKPGDEIVMADGDWNDVRIRFLGYGKRDAPITLKAETAGKVLIKGNSDVKLGGEYLVMDGLYFTDGASPSRSVIEFGVHEDTVANHSIVRNCVLLDFNKPQRDQTDIWVQFHGRHNALEHSYLAGKSNTGPTVRIDLAGNRSINNYHSITNNYFGPRPPKGGPSAETIQIGNSYTSMAPSYTLVANNFFDSCNGEVEVISSKTNFNEFRNNVFYKSEGSLVTRHGNYCTIDGNYFIGDEHSEQIGGVRLIGTGHKVTNNYFYHLKGKVFRSPLAVMNGIPKSPLNRYIQVTDVVVAYNSWINCTSPLQFGVGSNVDQVGILPPSEIRSERPIRTIVANNLIYNTQADRQPLVAHDSLDGISFRSNLINNQGMVFAFDSAFKQENFSLVAVEHPVLAPSDDFPDMELFKGFEFEQISKDLFGNARSNNNVVGAIVKAPDHKLNPMDRSKYGPAWYHQASVEKTVKTHDARTTAELMLAMARATDGDTITLTAKEYEIKTSLKIDKKLTIRSKDPETKVAMFYTGAAQTPAFEMNPKGKLTLMGISLRGTHNQYAFASLQTHMSSLYNLAVLNGELADFDYVLKGYQHSFAEYINLESTLISNCRNGLELSAETDDRGAYNAENVLIENCRFENVGKNVVDYYRGGYDESTVGGNLKIKNSSFVQSGYLEENGVLINTYGIINVDLSDNTFTDNKVKFVARLWGAKNNSYTNNRIKNSGELVVEENLPLKLMY